MLFENYSISGILDKVLEDARYYIQKSLICSLGVYKEKKKKEKRLLV